MNIHGSLFFFKWAPEWRKKNRWGLSAKDLILFLGREPLYGFVECESTLGIEKKSFEDKFHVRYLNHLEFEKYEILSWSLRKTEKCKEKKSVDLGNKWSMALFQKELAFGKQPKISLKWISPLIGHGIFAGEDIPALSYIGEYTGIVRRRRLHGDQFNHYIFGYVIGPSETPFVIDAKDQGNLMRFVNHSDEPNLTSRWMIFQGMSHVILFANRFIPKGGQLTYDYGPNYWRKRSMPLPLQT